ncbi:hypothetical protein GS966_27860 [Rhodococcus hoagii]|nr:hypothetical protein [Prescottella equi]NKS10255.1 hypothetical protein [Prescottella equi]NKS35246.1 hypothetical protein [Prescottella equi]NKS62093.1 hypothetical protein [Prescottella equi]NKW53053.1 hypothetical protein [Prescottella equi]
MTTPSRSGPIDRDTRLELKELLLTPQYYWMGSQTEIAFLAEVYDLEDLPSNDHRFETAHRDIDQHIRFGDWDEDWVFNDPRFEFMSGSDETVLRFVAHTLHPRVRRDGIKQKQLLKELNELLAPCGYELYEKAGRTSSKFVYRSTSSFHPPQPEAIVVDRAQLGDPETLHLHLKRIEGSIESDPAAAIGSCKELVESVIAQILQAQGVTVGNSDPLARKFRAAATSIGLELDTVPGDPRSSASVVSVNRGLVSTVQSLGELRNSAGTGHGRAVSPAVTSLHARLAFNTAVAVTEYLFGAWEEFNA